MASIKFIPSQMDTLAGTSTQAARESPFLLLLRDVGILLKMLPYIPYVIIPFFTSDKSAELYLSFKGTSDIGLQGVLFVVEFLLLLFTVPAFLVLPGTIILAAAGLAWLIIYVVAFPLHGSPIVYANMADETKEKAKGLENEKWLFINGCLTGYGVAQKSIWTLY